MSDETMPVRKWPDDFLDADRMDGPAGWIQWKGTDVCMDVTCACGAAGHFDGDFVYFLRCPECGRVYSVGQSVRLYEMTPEEVAAAGADPQEIE